MSNAAPHALNYVAFGPRLRRERQRQKRSLRDLATAVGVSASLISQIETGKAQPSVSTLYALVTSLGLSMGEVFTAAAPGVPADGPGEFPLPDSPEPGIARTSAIPVQNRTQVRLENGVQWDRLTPPLVSGTEFLLVRYGPGAKSSPRGEFQRHAGWEWGYVLRGRLTVSIGFDDHVLDPGMAISYHSRTPHRLANDGHEPVEAVWFVVGRDDDRIPGPAASEHEDVR